MVDAYEADTAPSESLSEETKAELGRFENLLQELSEMKKEGTQAVKVT